MPEKPDDLCPRPQPLPAMPNEPVAPPIFPATVYRCDDPDQADRLLAGTLPGYVYVREGHPNADLLAEKCRRLHAAERAAVTASGMAALSAALLSQLEAGGHVVVSSRLYGRSLGLWTDEAVRLGIGSTTVDPCDLAAVEAAFEPRTRLVVVETIANPTLRVADVAALAALAHGRGARLLVDNTFASPILCRPLELGADLVMESVTKIINGHGDVILGLLCGRAELWQRVPAVISGWGMVAGPIDCWLASRGLGTLSLRVERAAATALELARWLAEQDAVESVDYPGLPSHPDHALAVRQFGERFGWMVTFTLSGGQPAAERFIAAARHIPFYPSLGELSTTLSHPASTSHRRMSAEARAAAGIDGGTIRLSVGIESGESIRHWIAEGLNACQTT